MIGNRLARHVLRSFVGPFLASLAGLGVLLVLFDLFDRVDECFRLLFSKNLGTGQALGTIGTFYAGRALAFLSGYGGLACLAGGALTVAVLHRNGELTAMRAAGVSVRRAFGPLLLAAVLIGVVQMAAAEYAVRPLAPAAEDALDVIYRRVPKRGRNIVLERPARLAVWAREKSGGERLLWKGKSNVSFFAKRVKRGGRLVEGLSVQVMAGASEGDSKLGYLVVADRAQWRGDGWVLTGGKFFHYSADKAFDNCSRLSCDISPTGLEARNLGLAGLSTAELFELRNDQAARVELWGRLSLPLVNVILLLVGLPLAVLGSARGGRLLPLGMALLLGTFYVLFAELGAYLGRGGDLLDYLERFRGGDWLVAMGGPLRMAVDLAVGLPHLLFLGLGIVLYWRMDR